MQSHIDVKMEVVDVINEYGAGDFSRTMTRLPGQKARISEVMDQVRTRFTSAGQMEQETQRIKQALDNTTTNVMIADADGIIRYMNRSVAAMLANAESDIRKELAHFDAKHLVGVNFDTFHKNPAHQRNLLGQLRGRAPRPDRGRRQDLLADGVTNFR